MPNTRCRDEHYLRMALTMARRGLGNTAPNPSVGAVVVDEGGVILGRGWTQPGGRPHAEPVALERAGSTAKGATLYVTLEPCSHHGQSPPCADAIVKAGVRRVVVGVADPDERVAGRGMARLREAGIEVVEDVMAGESVLLGPALGHILRVLEQRPFVQMKIATSRDGLIAPGTGKPVWVTGQAARARGHLLRAKADAILVGIGTVLADDPSLDCRLPGLAHQSPDIYVLDNRCRLPLDARITTSKRLARVATTVQLNSRDEVTQRAFDLMDAGVQLWSAPRMDQVPLGFLLEDMASSGVTRLLVEGGPRVWRSFLAAQQVDEIVLFQGAGELGAEGVLPFNDRGLDWLATLGFKQIDQRAVGTDEMTIWRIEG